MAKNRLHTPARRASASISASASARKRGWSVVSASISKTERKRKIDMPENLLEWLAPYRLKRGAIFKIDPRKRIAKVVKASKVKWWRW